MRCAMKCDGRSVDALQERPAGLQQAQHYRDGLRILLTIVGLMRRERPLIFFTAIFAFFAVLFHIGIPV